MHFGTATLNRVVQRKGLEVGLICNKGFEHIVSMGCALQCYLGYVLEERLRLNTHRYDGPLIPLERVARRDRNGQMCKALLLSLLESKKCVK